MMNVDKEKLNKVKEKLVEVKQELVELLPEKFRERFEQSAYIGGGAIYSLYNNQEPKDYDFFLDDPEFADELSAVFFVLIADFLHVMEGFKDNRIYIGYYKDKRAVVTTNGISIGKFQIITRWSGTPEEVINEFDFKHNMFYYHKNNIETFSQWDFLEDNKLRYNEKRARDICGTIIRVKKFVERGFTITNKEMAKMLSKLNEVGFNEREVEILEKAEGNFES